MFLSLAILSLLLAGVYYLNKKLGTAAMGSRKSRYMKTLDRLMLARDRWIEIVQVGDDVMIIGVTAQSFRVLKTMTSESFASVEANSQDGAPFKSVLEKFMNNMKNK